MDVARAGGRQGERINRGIHPTRGSVSERLLVALDLKGNV